MYQDGLLANYRKRGAAGEEQDKLSMPVEVLDTVFEVGFAPSIL